jgi:TusA-related sulfurtransferase
MQYDAEVNAKGERCPMPLLRAKQQLNRMQSGQCLRVEATDAGSLRDFRAFAQMAGHRLLEEHIEPDVFVYFLIKG